MPLAGRLRAAWHVAGRLFSVNRATVGCVPSLFARNERVVCAFDGEHGPFVLVLVGALFVGSMSTVWHGQVTPWRRAARGGHAPAAAGPARGVHQLEADGTTDLWQPRGAELGLFNMGSTVLLLLPPGLARWNTDLQPGAERCRRPGTGRPWSFRSARELARRAPHWRRCACAPQLLAAARRFFAERRVLEVDTPALVRHAVTDPHIHSAQVQLPGHAAPLYLHTSPEYAMKRLLAAGSGDIYQIAHVFRGEETSRLHNAEFTLIEWYRCGYSMQQLMQEVAELARALLGLAPEAPVETLSYEAAFQRELDCASAQRQRRGAALARYPCSGSSRGWPSSANAMNCSTG